jgi:FlaA1/EpsC-like NDP-sugar epimerase
MPPKQRKILLILMDGILVNLAYLAALLIRFEGHVPFQYLDTYLDVAIPFTIIWLASFYALKLYHKLWQYASIGELLAIVSAVTVGALANTALMYFLSMGTGIFVPRSIIILLWVLNIVFIGGTRLGWRIFRDNVIVSPKVNNGGMPVLIVGAGDAGAMVARELKSHYRAEYNPIGFLDCDPKKLGLELMGIPVLGDRHLIPELVRQYSVQQVILAIPSAPKKEIREIVEICQEAKVKVRTLPGVYDLIDGKVSVKDIRDVDVEDLLGREPVSVDLESIACYLEGSVVLVTGAGGSIGSELCRQIARFAPGLLILLDNYENSLYEIELELKHSHGTVPLEVQVVDIKDSQAVKGVFEAFRPGVVFHAAAHKHVPLMENNPVSAVKNNIIGTKNLVEAADRWGTSVFISISTDKAVNPTSVMGASKRVSEIIIQHYNTLSRTRFSAVRFGNVLASKGSVVPIFKRQIAAGGPVTVTHPEMTRYFMTIPEAVQLVIQAGALSQGGEIFVLDMGEQVKIVDLARTLIKLSGFEPEKDIEIVYTGIRPGEKLYEELLTEKEGVDVTRHERIYVSKIDSYDVGVLEPILINLSRRNFSMSDKEAIELLEALVPGYKKYSQEDQPQAMNG